MRPTTPIGHSVDGRVVGGFVLALGPAVLAVVEVDVATAMRVERVHTQERMASADFLDVHEKAVGRFREEGRDFRQVGVPLRREHLLTGGLATPEQCEGRQGKGPYRMTR
jgi:hypothetical protein